MSAARPRPDRGRRGARRAAVRALLLLPVVPAVSLGAPVLRYEDVLRGDPSLERPVAATVGPENLELCITDAGSRTIDVFDAHGLHRFRTDEMSGLSMPRDACVDSGRGFVFLDHDVDRGTTIRRLNFLGEPEPYEPEIPREGWAPQHLLLTRDGPYVTVDGQGLLAEHDPESGALRWKRELVDPAWERSDLLGRPAEAADGRIYVPNAGSGVVHVVEADGSSHTSFGRRGTKRGELAFPVGVAFAPGDVVLVLDQMKHTILVYDAACRFVTELGRFGFSAGELYFPVAIAAGPDGRVYVAQGFEGRVQTYRLADSSSEP